MLRRDFLRSLMSGAAVTAAGLLVPELVKPERRIWQVGMGAPVGSRVYVTINGVTYGAKGTIVYAVDDDVASPLNTLGREIGTLVEYTGANTGWVRIGGREPPPQLDFMSSPPQLRDWLGPKMHPGFIASERERLAPKVTA